MKFEKSSKFFVMVAAIISMVIAYPSDGWTAYSILHNFEGPPTDGRTPTASLIQDSTFFYGVTQMGSVTTDAYCGSDGCGVIFKVKKDGSGYTVLHSFRDGTALDDGAKPYGSLVLSGSTLYGMTAVGGGMEPNGGTIFRINTDGSDYAILHRFGGYFVEGGYLIPYEYGPNGSLTLSGSTLYGMVPYGGIPSGGGVIFKINTDGSDYTILHSFRDGTVPYDGFNPQLSHLTLSGSTLYGITEWGGVTVAILTALERSLRSTRMAAATPFYTHFLGVVMGIRATGV